MSFRGSSHKSIHKLQPRNEESGSIFIEVLFTFVAQLFLSLGVIILFTQIARAEVMSFQDWKKLKLNEAQVQSEPVVEGGKPSPASVSAASAATPGSGIQKRSPRVEPSKLAIQIAQQLNIEDYFALYLSQFKDRGDFVEAAKKLNPTEMGDLLLTLKNSLDRGSGSASSNSGVFDHAQSLSFTNLGSPSMELKK